MFNCKKTSFWYICGHKMLDVCGPAHFCLVIYLSHPQQSCSEENTFSYTTVLSARPSKHHYKSVQNSCVTFGDCPYRRCRLPEYPPSGNSLTEALLSRDCQSKTPRFGSRFTEPPSCLGWTEEEDLAKERLAFKNDTPVSTTET